MLLTIDAGNTNTVFALIDDGQIIEHWRISTQDQRTYEEYSVWIAQLLSMHNRAASNITGAIISTVVPQVLWPLEQLCKKMFECEPLVVGKATVALGLDIQVDNPAEVGADRLVNAIAAHDLYSGPCIVVDFGTATTFDVVGEGGAYLGGIICPGVNLSLRALHQAAAKLPLIAVAPPDNGMVTGKSTLSAMQSGVFWGYISMIEGLVERLRQEHGRPMQVIATGGLAPIFTKHCPAIDIVDGDLTLHGLCLIHRRNNA